MSCRVCEGMWSAVYCESCYFYAKAVLEDSDMAGTKDAVDIIKSLIKQKEGMIRRLEGEITELKRVVVDPRPRQTELPVVATPPAVHKGGNK